MINEKQYDIPTSVIEGLEVVRSGGKYNMFESQSVFVELFNLGYYEAVDWLLNPLWKEGSYKSQVDTKKYSAALRELAEVKEIALKLSN